MKIKQLLLKSIRFFLFFPRRAYYAAFSPNNQFFKLIEAVKKQKPNSYTRFEKILVRRFECIDHPNKDMHRFRISVGEDMYIWAYYEVDDWDEGLKWISLNGPKGEIHNHEFSSAYGAVCFN